MPQPYFESLNNVPDGDTFRLIGRINHAWAELDIFASAALFSALSLDPIEFAILIGRLEPEAKIHKLCKIYEHRKDKAKSKSARTIVKALELLKPTRNAITHGRYDGKAPSGELFWTTTADLMLDQSPSAHRLTVLTEKALETHLQILASSQEVLASLCDIDRVNLLLQLPSRIGSATGAAKPRNDRALRPRSGRARKN